MTQTHPLLSPPPHPQRNYPLRLIGSGLILELVGLGLDIGLHESDPSLAAREGVFTLTNPGHFLFVLGLGLIILGAAAWLWPRVQSLPLKVSPLGIGLALLFLAGLGSAALAFAKHPHLHADPAQDG